MCFEYCFDVAWIDLVTAPVDEELLAAGKIEPAGGISPAQITAEEVPVLEGRLIGQSIVGGYREGTSYRQLCQGAGLRHFAVVVQQLHLDSGQWPADRLQRAGYVMVEVDTYASGFGRAIELPNVESEALMKFMIPPGRHRGAG